MARLIYEFTTNGGETITYPPAADSAPVTLKRESLKIDWPPVLPPGCRAELWNERQNRCVDTDVSGWKLTYDATGTLALYQEGPPPKPYVFASKVRFLEAEPAQSNQADRERLRKLRHASALEQLGRKVERKL